MRRGEALQRIRRWEAAEEEEKAGVMRKKRGFGNRGELGEEIENAREEENRLVKL